MVQDPSFQAVSILSNPTASTNDKVQAAGQLKNLIIGHEQRKALAVKHGIIQPLSSIISSATRNDGKGNLQSNGVAVSQHQNWTAEDELTVQCTIVVGSLAAGGEAFLQPLCAADVPKALVDALSTETPSRLAVAILHALKTLAFFWPTAEANSTGYDFWATLFNAHSIGVFDSLLRLHNATTTTGIQQLTLVAEIISAIPEHTSPDSRALVTNSGILDTLASLLAAHAIEQKLVWYRGNASQHPASPSKLSLPSILAALAAITAGSIYRAYRFILAPTVRDLFINSGADAGDQRTHYGARHGFANSHQSLLPPLHILSYNSVSQSASSRAFPALKTMQTGKPGNNGTEPSPLISDVDHSNAVCGWLLVLSRSLTGSNRLVALRLLAIVSQAIDADPVGSSQKAEHQQKTRERHRQLALLAVPLALQLVQIANESKSPESVAEQKDLRFIKEQACEVLALLIWGSKELQVAAVQVGAIKHTASLLRKSFDNVPPTKPMWSARPASQLDPNASASRQLGKVTLVPEIAHVMRCRKAALNALEALAAEEDLHRKAIIDTGVVSFMIDSLKPFPSTAPTGPQGRPQLSPKDGNTTQVILAACRAARAISRSVSILRTSLIDGGIAKPLVSLLNHSSLDVQIAATDVCCNLLPDFSPMREDITNGAVISTLVEHARSSSAKLRLSSIWALKHLVLNCPKEVKLQTLDELGTGWLVDIIQGELRQPISSGSIGGGGVSVGLSTPNAAGEQVDLLNPSSMDVDEPGVAEETMDEDDEDGEMLYDEASSTHYQSSQMRSTLDKPAPAFNSKRYLSSIREIEQNLEYTSRKDEAEIQVHALDFIRNLINGEDCVALSDYLMSQIGSAKVYDLLTAKLLPVTRAGGRAVYNLTDLVLSAIHVIIHLANASPKHRQMIIAQRPLLQAMLPHFNHLDHRVRVMCVWAVNSLTWIEEDGDRRDARQRSSELKTLGIEVAVRKLQNDTNLDVRERVKTAIRQFDTL